MRVKLSPQVGADALARLHGGRFEAPPFGELFARAGAAALRPVYDLSAEEIAEDKYGFAREFSLTLKPGSDLDAASALLAASDLVEEVRSVRLRRGYSD